MKVTLVVELTKGEGEGKVEDIQTALAEWLGDQSELWIMTDEGERQYVIDSVEAVE
jgi:hypothetical protein